MSTKSPHTEKVQLHPRNIHRAEYDFDTLVSVVPELRDKLLPSPRGGFTLNFGDPCAVKLLNKALLAAYYDTPMWGLPEGFLCPPVPGRVDYLHYLADLLAKDNDGRTPVGKRVSVLDIGTGANCIYPILGSAEYGWKFIASDIASDALQVAKVIVASNRRLKPLVDCRLQTDPSAYFNGVIKPHERVDVTLCNPPFHSSAEEANAGTRRKARNLKRHRKHSLLPKEQPSTALNFGGQSHELWCSGGEALFIQRMAFESRGFAEQCLWFSTLVAKKEHLKGLYQALKKAGATEVRTVSMAQGNKISRFVAWSFLDSGERQAWAQQHWVVS